jgi:vacuolar-type H+-ATPase subunit F/Vma7
MSTDKIAFIVTRDTDVVFKSLGIVTHSISDSAPLLPLLNKLRRQNFWLIFIAEELALKNISTIKKFSEEYFLPLLTVIPEKEVREGVGKRIVEEAVKRVLGKGLE